jgi:choline dehydrogenase-like flavoprotein
MMLEPAIPSRPSVAKWAGLPWIRAGVVEIGGSTYPIDEALLYDSLPMPRTWHKDLMRSSPLRDRLLGVQMLGEDLPQLANCVDLDSSVKDIYGLPVARITYSLHAHERVASFYWGTKLREVMLAAGADRALFYPAGLPLTDNPTANNTRHILGTMRMGPDPASSVCDEFGRMHEVPNVIIGDGSVFPTSGAFNPTLTLMAVALRSATALAHGEGRARRGSGKA